MNFHKTFINLTSLSRFFITTTGDCINSSPAGKRRIAAEKQLSQLTDEGNLFNSNSNDAALIDGGGGLMTAADSASTMDQIKSPVTFVGVVAVAICSVIVIMFVTIFTVLQVSLNAEDGRYILVF